MLPFEATYEQDKLEAEFLDYQLMEEEISNDVWESAVIKVDEAQKYYRMGKIRNYLQSMTSADGVLKFHRLARVAKFLFYLTQMHRRRGSSA